MFAGIVAGRGRVLEVGRSAGAALRLVVDVRALRRRPARGASVSVSGVCLTVVACARRGAAFAASFDVVAETLRRTTLGDVRPGDEVNLEGSLRLGDEVGGHLVQGHVDGVGTVASVEDRGDETWMTVRAPRAVLDTLVEKGWVAVDGASLTVAAVGRGAGRGTFSVALIPETLRVTTLGAARRGTRVHLEGDPLGKQVAAFLARRGRRPSRGLRTR